MNMPISSIRGSQRHRAIDYIKQLGSVASGASVDYIKDVMPITTSTLSGSKQALNELESTFSNASSRILPKINNLKNQSAFSKLTTWFMQKENDFSMGDFDSNMTFDIGNDSDDGSLLCHYVLHDYPPPTKACQRT